MPSIIMLPQSVVHTQDYQLSAVYEAKFWQINPFKSTIYNWVRKPPIRNPSLLADLFPATVKVQDFLVGHEPAIFLVRQQGPMAQLTMLQRTLAHTRPTRLDYCRIKVHAKQRHEACRWPMSSCD
jgi:hypothetical protein